MSMEKQILRGKMWITRLGSAALIGSVVNLRKAAGNGGNKVIEPKELKWAELTAGGVSCEIVTPPGAPLDAVLLYLHGGGGVLGIYNSSRKIIGHISAACKMKAVYPEYRLAPEFPFPNALNDCVAVYRWLLAEGYDPQRIVILGDSMGGYLTISTLLTLKEKHLPLPAAVVCISPVIDPTCSGITMKTNARKDALLSPKFMRECMAMYVGQHPLEDPTLSPLTASLNSLPPILIQAGEKEILLDDARRLHQHALAHDVECRLVVWPDMWHDWHVCVPDLKDANEAIAAISVFVKSRIGM